VRGQLSADLGVRRELALKFADGQSVKASDVVTALIDTAASAVLGAMGSKVTADGGSLSDFLIKKNIKGISANLIGQAVGNIIQNQWASILAQWTGNSKVSAMSFIATQVGSLLLGALPTDVAADARVKLGIQ